MPGPTQAIPGYQVIGKIGVGGTAAVFKALEIKTNKTVALKILLPQTASNPALLDRFKREAELLTKFQHENIVKGYSYGRLASIYYFVMEYIEGSSVQEMIDQKGSIPEELALNFILQIARALDYIEKQGIIHRDIKPGNLMLMPRTECVHPGSRRSSPDERRTRHEIKPPARPAGMPDRRLGPPNRRAGPTDRRASQLPVPQPQPQTEPKVVKLCDLGFAQPIASVRGHVEMTSGTPQYMSPEQVQGQLDLDIRSDIYSLGATLFHMVTGNVPFRGTDNLEVMAKQVLEDLKSGEIKNRGLSPLSLYVIEKMMAKDKDFRYQNPAAIIEDIQAQIAGFNSLEYHPE